MDKERNKLVRAMRAAAQMAARTQGAAYLGTISATLNVSAGELRKLARVWVRDNRDLPPSDMLRICDGLFAGKTHQEKAMAAIILGYANAARAEAGQERIEGWLGHLHGWAEVDALCSNVFQYEEMLGDWSRWKALLNRLSRDANINKRRASLVLLTGPVRYSDDVRLSDLAFSLIELLKSERDILITKAISWLLRNLSLRHKGEVATYLKSNETVPPRIAVRETMLRLKTGTKSGKSKKRR